jgi:hypothetical protein
MITGVAMKLQGWMPNIEKLFEQWVITLVEHNSFWLFVGLSVIAILCLNLLNNIVAIIKIHFVEFYAWIAHIFKRKK